jgi:hypothetical protein
MNRATKRRSRLSRTCKNLVQTISSDKAKLKVYCEISKLQEEMEKAEEKNDTRALEALGTKVDSLEQQIGPDYIRVIDGLGEVDPNSMEGQKFTAILNPLHTVQIASLAEEPSWWQYERLRRVPPISPRRRQDRPRLVRPSSLSAITAGD